MARSRPLACLAVLAGLSASAASGQEAVPPSPLSTPDQPQGSPGTVRRPQGVPPGTILSGQPGPPPAPRELTPAELQDLRSRMVRGTRDVILKPDEITEIRRSVTEAQGAGTFPGRNGRMPTPQARHLTITQRSSMTAPETLNLAYGVVSPITFVDNQGRPWPITSVAYDPRLFAQDGAGCGTDVPAGAQQVQAAAGGDRPTSINLMPCRIDTWGNILIRLEGYAYPVALMALSGSSETVDIPVVVKVTTGNSPLTPVRVATAGPTGRPAPRPLPGKGSDEGTQTTLLHLFGAGTPPREARTLRASGGGAQAWLYGGKMYVRGPGTLINPPHEAAADAPNGMKVWQLARPASRLMAELDDGSDVAIAVEY